MTQYATALYNYAARYNDELSLFENERVEVLEQTADWDGWCKAIPLDRQCDPGIVPRNYLQFDGEAEPEPEAFDESAYYYDPFDDYDEFDAEFEAEFGEEGVVFQPVPTGISNEGEVGAASSEEGKVRKAKKPKKLKPKVKDRTNVGDATAVTPTLKVKKSKKKSSVDLLADSGDTKKKSRKESSADSGDASPRPQTPSSDAPPSSEPKEKEKKMKKSRALSVEDLTLADPSSIPAKPLKSRSASVTISRSASSEIAALSLSQAADDTAAAAEPVVGSPGSSSSGTSLTSRFKFRTLTRRRGTDAADERAESPSPVTPEGSASEGALDKPPKAFFGTWGSKKSTPKGKIPTFDQPPRPITVMVPSGVDPSASSPSSLSVAMSNSSVSTMDDGASAASSAGPSASSSIVMFTPTNMQPPVDRAWYNKIEDPLERESRLMRMTKAQKSFQAAAHELRDTEQDYIDDLDVILVSFKARMRDQKIIRQDKIDILFSNIEDLKSVSQWFLYELDVLLAEGDYPMFEHVGEAFIKSSSYFAQYTTYCCNHPHAMDLYRRKMGKEAFANFVKTSASLPECKNLTLESFLIKPIQRICKYPLLIRELLRHAGDDHPDKASLEEAMSIMEKVVAEVNESKRRAENLEKLNEVALKIKFDDPDMDLFTVDRFFQYEGVATALQDGKPAGERHIFLFNDLLVVATKAGTVVSGEKYRAVLTLELASAAVNDFFSDADESKRGHLCIFKTGQKNRYRIITHTFDFGSSVDRWLTEFEKTKVQRNADPAAGVAVSAQEKMLIQMLRSHGPSSSALSAEMQMEAYAREAELRAAAELQQEQERQREIELQQQRAAAAAAAAPRDAAAEKAAKKRAMARVRKELLAQAQKRGPPSIPARTYQSSSASAAKSTAPVPPQKPSTPLASSVRSASPAVDAAAKPAVAAKPLVLPKPTVAPKPVASPRSHADASSPAPAAAAKPAVSPKPRADAADSKPPPSGRPSVAALAALAAARGPSSAPASAVSSPLPARSSVDESSLPIPRATVVAGSGKDAAPYSPLAGLQRQSMAGPPPRPTQSYSNTSSPAPSTSSAASSPAAAAPAATPPKTTPVEGAPRLVGARKAPWEK